MLSLLINKQNLIDNCGVSKEADDSRVNMAIEQAHHELRSIFCRDYYDYLVAHNDAGDLAGYHLTLLNSYIVYFLSWLAYSKFVVIGSQTNTKAGFREHTDEHSQPVTEVRLNSIKKNAEEQVLYYKAEMMYYINNNISEFSTYANSDCYNKRKVKTFKITGAGHKRREYYE